MNSSSIIEDCTYSIAPLNVFGELHLTSGLLFLTDTMMELCADFPRNSSITPLLDDIILIE